MEPVEEETKHCTSVAELSKMIKRLDKAEAEFDSAVARNSGSNAGKFQKEVKKATKELECVSNILRGNTVVMCRRFKEADADGDFFLGPGVSEYVAALADLMPRLYGIFRKKLPRGRPADSQRIAGDYAVLFNKLGLMMFIQSDTPRVLTLLDCLRSVKAEAPAGGTFAADTAIHIANLSQKLGNTVEAEQLFREALAIFDTVKADKTSLFTVHLNLASLCAHDPSGARFQEAEDHNHEALAIVSRLHPNSEFLASTLDNIANLFALQGRAEAAEPYVVRSLALKQRLGLDPARVAASEETLGSVYMDMGCYGDSATHYERALQLRQQAQPCSIFVNAALHNLANLHERCRNWDQAHAYYVQEAALLPQLPSQFRYLLPAALEGVGRACQQLGRSAEAAVAFESAAQEKALVAALATVSAAQPGPGSLAPAQRAATAAAELGKFLLM